ncbi:MAG: DsrE family protein [Nitrospirae bacterium]|nr:DsrE family protein [Nitrospirota bacterium]
MKLGIFVNTDRHAKDLIGLTKASQSKGHEVIVFFMDDGVKLLSKKEIAALCKLPGVSISYCDYSTQKLDVQKNGVCGEMVCGSQYNNAMMNHEADRVIVL